MASIVGKKQGGRTNCYLVESALVGGKPRIVSQRYFGSAEELGGRLTEAGPIEPDRIRHLAFGDIAAVWEMLRRLRVAEITDEVLGARRSDAEASVGTYIALATLNRVVDPCSKLACSKRWDTTAGDRWLALPTGALDHRRFWETMDAIEEEDVKEIERRLVVCHSDGLHARQSRGFDQTLGKAHRQLAVLQARLAGGRTRKAREKVEAEIAQILAPRWVSRQMTWSLTGRDPAELRLSFHTDAKARAALEEEIFGKRILFSDKAPEQASTRTIVSEHRSQEAVEGDFRQMKDPKVVSFSPMFHFTEQKIRVHVLYCVLALMVARLMVREADHAGMHMSVRELLDHLSGIEETLLLYQGERGRPRARRMLTDMDPTQRRLYDLFNLNAYAPKR